MRNFREKFPRNKNLLAELLTPSLSKSTVHLWNASTPCVYQSKNIVFSKMENSRAKVRMHKNVVSHWSFCVEFINFKKCFSLVVWVFSIALLFYLISSYKNNSFVLSLDKNEKRRVCRHKLFPQKMSCHLGTSLTSIASSSDSKEWHRQDNHHYYYSLEATLRNSRTKRYLKSGPPLIQHTPLL